MKIDNYSYKLLGISDEELLCAIKKIIEMNKEYLEKYTDDNEYTWDVNKFIDFSQFGSFKAEMDKLTSNEIENIFITLRSLLPLCFCHINVT
jgi:hypothetical protein